MLRARFPYVSICFHAKMWTKWYVQSVGCHCFPSIPQCKTCVKTQIAKGIMFPGLGETLHQSKKRVLRRIHHRSQKKNLFPGQTQGFSINCPHQGIDHRASPTRGPDGASHSQQAIWSNLGAPHHPSHGWPWLGIETHWNWNPCWLGVVAILGNLHVICKTGYCKIGFFYIAIGS